MDRKQLLHCVAVRILSIELNHPIRVAIDGVDGSGKTYFADELAEELKKYGRQIIRISVDNFHNSRDIRYQRGRNSPEGFYLDSYDKESIIKNVLQPLGENGNLEFKRKIFDVKTDNKIDSPTEKANSKSILLMDGIFLQRPEFAKKWDLKIFLDVDFEFTVSRAVKRDGWYLGSEKETAAIYNERYVPGQKLYFNEAQPKKWANIVIDNSVFCNPKILKDVCDSGVSSPLPKMC